MQRRSTAEADRHFVLVVFFSNLLNIANIRHSGTNMKTAEKVQYFLSRLLIQIVE